MKLQRIPVIVTTHEALDIALAEKMCVIYVDNELYLPHKDSIDFTMRMFWYHKPSKHGNKGAFFVRTHGENRFDENNHEICDPCGIL